MRVEITIVLLVLLILSACDSMEMPERAYDSKAEVVRDGAIQRGWVPQWLPETARDIREKHDLDTNISQLTFRFDALGPEQLAESCRPIDREAVPMPRKTLVDWWPSELRDSPATSFSFHACADDSSTAYLAIDERQRRACFWRP